MYRDHNIAPVKGAADHVPQWGQFLDQDSRAYSLAYRFLVRHQTGKRAGNRPPFDIPPSPVALWLSPRASFPAFLLELSYYISLLDQWSFWRDWSLIIGRGGGLQNGKERMWSFTPTKKNGGGGGGSFSHAEGGGEHSTIGVVFMW